jgi:hypothetical protein
MADGTQEFRRSFWHCVKCGLGLTFSLFAVATVLRLMARSHGAVMVSSRAESLVLVGFFVFSTTVVAAMSQFYGLEASTIGLRVRSWTGRTVDVPWHAIQAVDPIGILGLPLLRLRYSDSTRPAFIPLWLTDPGAFRAAAADYGGGNNVLVRWLLEHPNAGRYRFL